MNPQRIHILVLRWLLIFATVTLSSCNREEIITGKNRPVIILDSDTGVYEIKVDAPLTIAPAYRNVDGASYAWTCEGELLSTAAKLTYTWQVPGTYYIELVVTTSAGTASEEMRVEVMEAAIPSISLPLSNDALTLALGAEYLFNPEIANYDILPTEVEWTVNGVPVADTPEFMFIAEEIGTFQVMVTASNADGSDSRRIIVTVLESLPVDILFPTPSLFQTTTTRYTFVDRPVFLTPEISGAMPFSYSWSVDGRDVGCDEPTFVFTPSAPGDFRVSVTVNGAATATVHVVCVSGTEADLFRPATPSSSPRATKVFEWVPAPGQFINDVSPLGGMTGSETSPETAAAWALKRFEEQNFVSLGAWGGYVIVGFDHSIPCIEGRYNFGIIGNAFANAGTGEGGNNEPGIVYVMQDVNGNGLPDDEWYQLRGSDTYVPTTWHDYAVTYYRPAAPGMDVQWTDNRGNSGVIKHMLLVHNQDYYYPEWITADSYTLRGTRLEARTSRDNVTGLWNNWPFAWGYADNLGSDMIFAEDLEGGQEINGMMISNAVNNGLAPIPLQYIDFVKIQTGVQATAGALGENSTEVFGVIDLTIAGVPSVAFSGNRLKNYRE